MSDGIHWEIALKVKCPFCGAQQFDEGGRYTEIIPAFNSSPDEDSLDQLRHDFVMNLELQGWEISGLDIYDDLGVFTCPPCVRKQSAMLEAVNA